MARLEWDRIEDRQYQLGIDRGVLYPADGSAAAAWNGLVSVNEASDREVKSWYQDGVKIFEHSIPKPYSGRIQAFTYPDVLDTLMGSPISGGIRVHEQAAQRFHLCYRTLVGSDLEGADLGYKIHLLYNLTAVPDDTTYTTLGAQTLPITFGFGVSGVPVLVEGMRPTTHISIDSRDVAEGWLAAMEETLYGGAESNPDILLPNDFF
jgi:hypothetical protein